MSLICYASNILTKMSCQMCITFFYFNSNPAIAGTYRLILILNRDEFYDRKSKNCHYWEQWPAIIGGTDLQSGSLGTWLAASINGKIGVLLNIKETPPPSIKESRGVLVANYLIKDIPAVEYIQYLMNENKIYEGHHLLLFDIAKDSISCLVVTCTNQGTNRKVTKLNDGIHGLSNSPMETPYKKVIFGRNEFEKIVQQYGTTDKENVLVAELLNLMKSEQKQYPDEVLIESKREFMPPNQIEKFSSVFVDIPESKYGCRTHTLILVDSENRMIIQEYKRPNGEILTEQWSCDKFEVPLNL